MNVNSGFLKLHSKDISQLHQLTDVLIVTLSFILINSQQINFEDSSISYWPISAFLTYFIFKYINLFNSFREKTLLHILKKIVLGLFLIISSLIFSIERNLVSSIFDTNGGVLFGHGFDGLRKRYLVKEFENNLTKFFSSQNAITTTSGTASIFCALKSENPEA